MEGAAWDAAIGSELACSIYGASVAANGIEDDARNYTRFLALRTRPERGPEIGKLSLWFTLTNAPGALHEAIGIFAERNVDLTRLDCRPLVGRPWEYRFYADLAPVNADLERELVAALERVALDVQVIGRYALAPGAHARPTREPRASPSGSARP